jgi:hypothetical protein
MRALKVGLGVLALALTLGLVATVHAQGINGTLVGDTGGAYQTWNVDLAPDTNVTVTVQHWPCDMGSALGLEAWGASGMLGSSTHKDACTEVLSFNSGAGGAAEIKLYNYAHGVGTWWTATSEGADLGGMAMAAETTMAEPAATTAMTTTATMTTTASAAMTETMAAETTAAPAMAAPVAMLSTSGTVFGDTGGAFANHDLTVTEGKTYTVKMTVGTEPGGNWNGMGFSVWGPNGLVTNAHMTDWNMYEATFTADGDVVYLVQPYNYNHGVTMWYALSSEGGE